MKAFIDTRYIHDRATGKHFYAAMMTPQGPTFTAREVTRREAIAAVKLLAEAAGYEIVPRNSLR